MAVFGLQSPSAKNSLHLLTLMLILIFPGPHRKVYVLYVLCKGWEYIFMIPLTIRFRVLHIEMTGWGTVEVNMQMQQEILFFPELTLYHLTGQPPWIFHDVTTT